MSEPDDSSKATPPLPPELLLQPAPKSLPGGASYYLVGEPMADGSQAVAIVGVQGGVIVHHEGGAPEAEQDDDPDDNPDEPEQEP